MATTALVASAAAASETRRRLRRRKPRQIEQRVVAAPEVVCSRTQMVLPNRPSPSLLEDEVDGLGAIVLEMYTNFNACNGDKTAACFTEDVVYEDLLLGNSTLVESRADFRELIESHPVFVAQKTCLKLGIPPIQMEVLVDGISEDPKRHSVGVEWHVEFDGSPLPMGRGLSYMRICPRTRLIQRAVDIAEAPWRVVGLVAAPLLRGFRGLSRLAASLLLPPVLVSSTGLLAVVALGLIFLDRSSMHELREEVDTLDDIRENMDAQIIKEMFRGTLDGYALTGRANML